MSDEVLRLQKTADELHELEEEHNKAVDRIAELEKALADEKERASMFREWANCGGVPSGKTCAAPEDHHEIYGPGITDDAGDWCELHWHRKALAEAQSEIERLTIGQRMLTEQRDASTDENVQLHDQLATAESFRLNFEHAVKIEREEHQKALAEAQQQNEQLWYSLLCIGVDGLGLPDPRTVREIPPEDCGE